jgi:hypothetical protein
VTWAWLARGGWVLGAAVAPLSPIEETKVAAAIAPSVSVRIRRGVNQPK